MTVLMVWLRLMADIPVFLFVVSMLCDTAIILALILTHTIRF